MAKELLAEDNASFTVGALFEIIRNDERIQTVLWPDAWCGFVELDRKGALVRLEAIAGAWSYDLPVHAGIANVDGSKIRVENPNDFGV